jgi:hypothetical protein
MAMSSDINEPTGINAVEVVVVVVEAFSFLLLALPAMVFLWRRFAIVDDGSICLRMIPI